MNQTDYTEICGSPERQGRFFFLVIHFLRFLIFIFFHFSSFFSPRMEKKKKKSPGKIKKVYLLSQIFKKNLSWQKQIKYSDRKKTFSLMKNKILHAFQGFHISQMKEKKIEKISL